MAARKTAQVVNAQPNRGHICTACPAVVRYVERYRPELIDLLVPVVSPMLAHARHLKGQLGREAKVVFIGPCVAKKAEAEEAQNDGWVDCVLTFTELEEWLKRENVAMSALEESSFDETPEGTARFFPLVGGGVRTASLTTDILAGEVISVSGFPDVKEVLGSLQDSPAVVEPLFCPQGCINGPAIPGDRNIYDRRKEVLVYAETHRGKTPEEDREYAELLTQFSHQAIEEKNNITEEEIRGILEKTGKSRPEDQLNCGACGYSSCREKAVAVLRGMAEVEMCIPYMKRLAEQRTDRIIETSPNGIIILDDRLNIIHMNPAFRRFFMCSEAVCGKRISYLMDPDPFEKLASGAEQFIEIVVKHERYNLVAHQILYPLKEEKQYVGIFVNITNSQASQQKLDQLRAQTIMQARELMEHQISMAQKIGQFLGESTARGEALVENLMRLAGDEGKKSSEKGNQWLWDIFTSK
jgi:PAS domain S-box-containing protein